MLEPKLREVEQTYEKYDFPHDVVVELTTDCNLRCTICPRKSLKRERGEMFFGLWEKIINEIAEENPNTRVWPSLMGDFSTMGFTVLPYLDYALNKNVPIYLNTNGVKLTPTLTQAVFQTEPKAIIFGIDAITPKTYHKIRLGGFFSKVMTHAFHILAYKPQETEFMVQFVETKENTHEMEDFKKFWLGMGVPVKLRPKLGWGNTIETEFLNVPDSERIPCGWLMRTATILWNGKMAQCDSDHEGAYSPGDINKQTIKEVWNGELLKRRKRHLNKAFPLMSLAHFTLCLYPCPSNADMSLSSSHTPYKTPMSIS
jgi:sulfatase maturation enzyme AslB (radical SAM superfamily)